MIGGRGGTGRLAAAACALGLGLGPTGVAHGNGRPPATSGIYFRPGDPHALYMAIGRSTDGGATFRKVWRFAELAGPLACPDGTAERDVCDRTQWPTVQAQLAATGPTCGAAAADAGPADATPPSPRGCCDAGDPRGALVGTAPFATWVSAPMRT